eukprot:TRINITY_DN28466_c1_g2_i1.p1 TRINITY_DN28466_c1_g2~~TRINITY_DN28466_c1_g2_i1.p1  ORF type:complete len:271 (+),score=77.53 TRINITY_DN28466_c1_g2_i1:25-813(+)
MESWQRLLVAAGGAVGVAAILYYLLREDGEAEEAGAPSAKTGGSAKKAAGAGADMSVEEFLEVMGEMTAMEQKRKETMRELAEAMKDQALPFHDLYARVAAAQSNDPLARRGLTLDDLDVPLQRYQNHPRVHEAMEKLMGGGDDTQEAAADRLQKAKSVTVAQIIEINKFMLKTLQEFIADYDAVPASEKDAYEVSTVISASEAVINARVTAKYDLLSEDLEQAMKLNETEIVQDQAFFQVHMQMKQTMKMWLDALSGTAPA